MHKGSKETYEYIANWVSPQFFFSRNDVWHRMGFLGVFADFVLSSIEGAVAEIGCGESSIYLSHVARKYGRRMYHCDIAPDKILNPLTVPGYMLSVDLIAGPIAGKQFEFQNSLFFMAGSDEFFADVNPRGLALSFIDGDHNYAQAKKDFENFLERTYENGYILLHDTYPPTEEYLCPDSKCGDVYKLRQELEKDPRVDVMTLPIGTAMGVGLTICRKKPSKLEYFNE